jgi:hypothetical protein
MGKYVVRLSVVGPTGKARIHKYLAGGAKMYANRLKDANIYHSRDSACADRDATEAIMKYLARRDAFVRVQSLAEAEAENARADAETGD